MNKYNDIELTQEELDGLSGVEETPKDIPKDSAEAEIAETTTSQLETTEESSKEVNDTDVDGDGFEIDGERYDADTIKAWMSDSQNKAEWQKSNTQKSQELAKWNKFAEKLNGDDEFKEHIKDFFFDSPDDFEKLGLDSLPVQETEEEPTHLEERMDRL